MDKIIIFLKEFGVIIFLGVLALSILGYGIYSIVEADQVKVEIIRGDESTTKINTGEIKVDVEGAVKKPGVYPFKPGSRIGDAIVMAGGFSEVADLAWVAKSLNLAEEIKDGGKIYIPDKSSLKNVETSKVDVKTQAADENGKVNLNTASMVELDSLEGIGEVRAKTILDNRPYSKVEDLVSKAKIPESVYEKIKDKVSVY